MLIPLRPGRSRRGLGLSRLPEVQLEVPPVVHIFMPIDSTTTCLEGGEVLRMDPLTLVSVCGRSLAHSSNGANLEGGDGRFIS